MTADELIGWVIRALLVGLVWGVVVTRVVGRRRAPTEQTNEEQEDVT